MLEENSEDEKEIEKPLVAKTATDLQRLKLMKLMKNPEKPIIIPERPKTKGTPAVPEFVRNVMGSSAGAGSGEFHVYRHLRRKEYSRQKYIQEKGQKELLDEEYHRKLEENKKLSEEITAKKRAKRLKRKQKLKEKKFNTTDKDKNNQEKSGNETDSDNESSDDKKVNEYETKNKKFKIDNLENKNNNKVSDTQVEETIKNENLNNTSENNSEKKKNFNTNVKELNTENVEEKTTAMYDEIIESSKDRKQVSDDENK